MEINRSIVRLVVDDFKSTFLFYRNIIGLQLDFGTEDDVVAEFDAGTVLLTVVDKTIAQDVAGSSYEPAEGKTGDKAVIVFQVRDLDGAIRELKAKGAQNIGSIVPVPDWHIRVVHLRDPEGNLVEIQSMPE